ncbi:MAG: ABC transporter permease [Clostridiales bacterium]|uniref:ABC transporter permease subunit n=1 Tax=Clostridium sp. N3C TaxID=1776758 RepID=UPI00092E131A|nr:ABC transporter permease [Clostridium sp. N3C]NLZ49923.1 ABC transporter permease [Clostridiales bacterium]SCN25798.1 ABC-type transport system involved in multi-copper enzyme maturation, permease component [Clostridium sp. N3C]
MMGLIKNEFKKLLLRKKILISSIVFGILCALMCLIMGIWSTYYTKKNQIELQQSLIKSYEEDLEKAETEDDKKAIQANLDEAKTYLQVIENMPSEDDHNWKNNVQTSINNLQEEFNTLPDNSGEKETIRKKILVYEELLNKDIKPMADSSAKGFKMLQYLIAALGSLFTAIIVIIISSDAVSSECTPPTLKMLLTRPVKRGKVLASKFIAAFISSCIVIIGLEIIASIVMGLIFGFGDPLYPIAVGTDYKITTLNAIVGKEAIAVFNSSYLTSTIVFLLKSILLQLLFILAATSFFLMISTLVKSSSASISISIVSLIAIQILSVISNVKPILPFLFMTYGNTTSILTGEVKYSTLSSLPSPAFAIIILLGWTMIPYIIAHLNFTKKDILV